MRAWIIVLLLFAPGVTAVARQAPRVEAAWASGPLEARIALDRAADPAVATALVGTRIVFGDDVKAGDRATAPGPDTPSRSETAASRGSIRVAAARLEDGGRTLVLATDPHSRDATYALSLPAPIGVDLAYSLRGVEVGWAEARDGAKPTWKGWSPTFDSGDGPGLRGLREKTSSPGRLTYRTLAALPKGKPVVTLKSSHPFELELGNDSARSAPLPGGGHGARLQAAVESDPIEMAVTIKADGKGPVAFESHVRGADAQDSRLALTMLTLPWAPAKPQAVPPSPTPEGLLRGGDPARGVLVFKGDQAKCANCHKVRGEGKDVGPDLSDLFRRDRDWVYRSISEPSASIHPDYVAYTVLTRDGRVLVGIVRAVGADAISVTDTEAKSTTIAKADIEELRPSAASIMPVGLLAAVGEEGVRDLIAFLTTAR